MALELSAQGPAGSADARCTIGTGRLVRRGSSAYRYVSQDYYGFIDREEL
jgi:hypothetical protein